MTFTGLLNPPPIFYHGRDNWTGGDLKAHTSGDSSANSSVLTTDTTMMV